MDTMSIETKNKRNTLSSARLHLPHKSIKSPLALPPGADFLRSLSLSFKNGFVSSPALAGPVLCAASLPKSVPPYLCVR